MRFLFDSDHLSILQRRQGPDYAVLSVRLSEHDWGDLAMSVPGFHEQVLGAHTFITRAKTPTEVIRGYQLLGQLLEAYSFAVVLPFDEAASTVYDRLVASKVRIGTVDLRVASIALSRGLTLLSRNLRDFRAVPGLAVEDWTA